MAVGHRIRELRKAAGYQSQEALARELGVAMMTVSRWERGQHKPSIDELYRIADVLGVTASELLDEEAKVA